MTTFSLLVRRGVQEEEEDQEDELVGVELGALFDPDLPHHVAHVDEGGVLQPLLREHRAAFVVVLVQLRQHLVDLHAPVDLEEPHHFPHRHSLVGRVGRDLVEKDVVNVDQQLALQLELLAILEVVVLELLLLVGLGRPPYFGVAVLCV